MTTLTVDFERTMKTPRIKLSTESIPRYASDRYQGENAHKVAPSNRSRSDDSDLLLQRTVERKSKREIVQDRSLA
jgi:hypothetical protein